MSSIPASQIIFFSSSCFPPSSLVSVSDVPYNQKRKYVCQYIRPQSRSFGLNVILLFLLRRSFFIPGKFIDSAGFFCKIRL